MSRRSLPGLLAVGLLVLLVLAAAWMPVPYVTIRPGPTINVLGRSNGKPIVDVEGHRTFPTKGQLRLVTVSVTNPEHHVSLGEALGAWVSSDDAVVPREVMYPSTSTDQQQETESSAEMVSSQDTAVAAALRALGYRLKSYAEVTGVTPGGPSDATLKPRDRFVRLDGARIRNVNQVFKVLRDDTPGDKVHGVVIRGGTRKAFDVTTQPAPDDPKRAIIGVLVSTGYIFPFHVSVGIDDTIGGPSAGLMFALSVYDTLTPGPLTGGAVVAGTGTITAGGAVGPIGGIQQKIVGASQAGARLFFVPPDNCDAAVLASGDALDRTRLVRADTLASAIHSLKAYAADPHADLPRCP